MTQHPSRTGLGLLLGLPPAFAAVDPTYEVAVTEKRCGKR